MHFNESLQYYFYATMFIPTQRQLFCLTISALLFTLGLQTVWGELAAHTFVCAALLGGVIFACHLQESPATRWTIRMAFILGMAFTFFFTELVKTIDRALK